MSITLAGDTTLAGSLEVEMMPGFWPQAGDTYDILDFVSANLNETFTLGALPDLPGMLGWGSSQFYSSGHAVGHSRTRHAAVAGPRHAAGVAEAVKACIAVRRGDIRNGIKE